MIMTLIVRLLWLSPSLQLVGALIEKYENRFDSAILTFAEEKKRANDMDKSADPEHSLAM